MQTRFLSFIGLICISASLARAAPAFIQPNEAASKDTWVYEFIPVTNEFVSGNFNSGGFAGVLTSAKSGDANTQIGSGHETRTLIQFDLTGVTLDPGDIAYLKLFVIDTALAGFGEAPSVAHPITTNVHAITGAWDEDTMTWGSNTPFNPTPLTSQVINHFNDWVMFDVTSQVQAWLNTPSTNFGFMLTQAAIVQGEGDNVAALYRSSTSTTASIRPVLQIVPEPAAIGCLVAFVPGLLRRNRKGC